MILNENDVQKRRVDKKRMQERIKEEYRNENENPARRGTILFDCHPDVRLRVKRDLNGYFAARYANPRTG